ncbi:MAG: hypothetical protein M9962_08815 [Oligoflexia bacterium]|nr:hypothetical protein [Oligoflexia bacterium]
MIDLFFTFLLLTTPITYFFYSYSNVKKLNWKSTSFYLFVCFQLLSISTALLLFFSLEPTNKQNIIPPFSEGLTNQYQVRHFNNSYKIKNIPLVQSMPAQYLMNQIDTARGIVRITNIDKIVTSDTDIVSTYLNQLPDDSIFTIFLAIPTPDRDIFQLYARKSWRSQYINLIEEDATLAMLGILDKGVGIAQSTKNPIFPGVRFFKVDDIEVYSSIQLKEILERKRTSKLKLDYGHSILEISEHDLKTNPGYLITNPELILSSVPIQNQFWLSLIRQQIFIALKLFYSPLQIKNLITARNNIPLRFYTLPNNSYQKLLFWTHHLSHYFFAFLVLWLPLTLVFKITKNSEKKKFIFFTAFLLALVFTTSNIWQIQKIEIETNLKTESFK